MEKTLFHLTKDDILILHNKMQLARIRSGQVLVREGVPPLGLFIVRSGSVLVQRNLNGFPMTVATLGQHEMFGEAAFMNPGHAATAGIAAAEDGEVVVLTPTRLNPVFQENPALFARFFHSIALVISRRLRAYNGQTAGSKSDRFGDLPSWEIL